ncbi:MAG: hypothetical protein JWM69_264 [Candidatus Binatus sp.]|nr:hypothetical protein [Candidatus Binatus sp.]
MLARGAKISERRWARRTGIIVLSILVLYGLIGFIAVPLVVYHVVSPKVAASLKRPVSIARFRFNPYRLNIDVRGLHVGDRDGSSKFVDVGHLYLKASWMSLFRLAPVLHEITVEQPAIHLVRNPDGGFNFSDLLEPSPNAPPPKPASSAPPRFAVSNIQLRDGDIRFDDKMLGKQHAVEKIQVGVPFLANLPSAVDIYVQPLLQMVIDGSPLKITGQSKPFEASRESEIDLALHRLDLPLSLGYVPRRLPVEVPHGTLSCNLQVHFVSTNQSPIVKVSGRVALDEIAIRDWSDAPLAELAHGSILLDDVEPLAGIAHVGRIYIGGLNSHLVRNADGTINLTAALAAKAPPSANPPAPVVAQPAATPAPVAQPATVPTPAATTIVTGGEASKPMEVWLTSFELDDSKADIIDNTGPTPAKLAIDKIHVGMTGFKLAGPDPAPFDLAATLGGGGAIAVKGTLDMPASQVQTDVSIDQVDLPALQGFAQSALDATIASGKLSAKANVKTDFGSKFNLHAEPAQVALENFQLNAPRVRESPIQWKRINANVEQVDLATHQANVSEVLVDGMRVNLQRERDGKISLLALLRTSPQNANEHANQPVREPASNRKTRRRTIGKATPKMRRQKEAPVIAAAPASPPADAWKYQVASIAIQDLQANVEDRSTPKPIRMAVAPLNLHLKNFSSDFAKAFPLDLDATINKTGIVKVIGTAAIAPLKANVKIVTRRLNLAVADPLVSSRLNASIKSAELTMNGAASAEARGSKFLATYRGDATLGRMNLLDKLTGDEFVKWNALSLNRIDMKFGEATPKIHVGAIALNDFYARIILNSNGKLNFKDITSSPQEAPTSLTRENPNAGEHPASPQPTPQVVPSPTAQPSTAAAPGSVAQQPPGAPAPAPSPEPLNADVQLGPIAMKGGKINYSDNFIKPNYSADLTDVTGKIGEFGSSSQTPADVALQGQVNGNSPLDITGAINPLAPLAFVDIKAKADRIELVGLSAYSTRYTGFPITKGALTVDVHYLLDKQNLTAENHIFIDQLTFGDKVESPDAMNLPIRLAVSLLKNSRGEIDLKVPVSGSLSDPQFSIGGVIWGVIKNLIMKAVTSPFSLIASAMGTSSGGGGGDIGHIDFAPGFATLTPESQKKLDTVAGVLKDRAGLKLGIQGRVDPALDRDGLRDAALMHAIQSQKEDGKSGAELDAVEIKPDEYDKYLKRAYKAAKFEKPHNAIGLNKSLPPDEMKKMMIANAKVSDSDLPQLADARAAVVRKYLSTRVDPARLFLSPNKLTADGIEDKGKTTRVDLLLE